MITGCDLMKKIFTTFLVSAFFGNGLASAQSKDISVHSTTTAGPQSRYEIVQSTLAARWTFRLDKVCGAIGQIASTPNDGVIWELMFVSGLPRCSNDGKVRYQIFTSGLAARHTFLINTETGKSWQVRTSKDVRGVETTAWFPFEEQ